MKFDLPVRVGEIRILADFPEPRLVLVLAAHGSFAFRVVPLSSCTAPASPREYALRGRVYQLWQTQTVGKAVLERSWHVERLDPEDFAEVERAQSADRPVSLTPVERAQVVSFAEISPTEHVIAKSARRALTPRRWIEFLRNPSPTASRLAAGVLLALGLFALFCKLPPLSTSTSSPHLPHNTAPILTVRLAKEPTPIDPLEEPAEDLSDESVLALTPVEITLPALAFEIPSPEATPQLISLAESIRLPGLPKIRGFAQSPVSDSTGTVPEQEGTGPATFAVQRSKTFDWLVKHQDNDGSWGQSLRGTALAVIALLTDGQTGTGPDETGTGPARRAALVAGVRYLTEQMGTVPVETGTGLDRQTAQLVACALSGGWPVTRNPNVKVAAERAIVAANSHLSVEAARDWTGLLVDLTPTIIAEPKSGHVATPRPEDELTAACLYLLQTAGGE